MKKTDCEKGSALCSKPKLCDNLKSGQLGHIDNGLLGLELALDRLSPTYKLFLQHAFKTN
ncbi:hypothetical protein A3740_09860 [Oleiphilus sp. HI0068]|nr:hypothetical protein A3740_18450 [Oleiphilus sp. HI0068]KZY76382.1 hypothetical protein A3741_23285 [Oleiphilus sp. HI0069]KZZ41225.1 hypothetical protein A3755_23770 [Oleiphilus sp. HI0085]KZZ75896.1 hypothetical protein A3766_15535 [Oleiphilus sp. HI0132]KZY77637.1 hypothetical protein A3740_09860 [Oleiphilus sp. HI0068]